ncbi:PREDICTED: disintegrin and metalloproteinase domain-containing protein 1a-like [Ceratotherium simum simum]|uniref:Disintegrin and metalloproteinase domain-containing protein 1a-like n=1 Tax=Ceratotherium simum simum TaxID=73337 RepID=A0ABM1CT38_CERSS|nr:PREDICTED: disintegrin and metalloproteinase domain-containing protein 1a-like [Ceratotherium simum simum]
MSVAASVRDCASLSSLQKNQVVMYEAGRVLQTGAPQMKGFRLALVPGPSRLSLGIMLVLLLIFLPGLYCDLGSVYYSTYEIVIPKCLTVKGREDPVEKASYMLFMQGQKQLIHLKVKRDYFVDNFPVFSYHDGSLGQEMPFISRDCHYEGYIEGIPGSFVSVNTCSGLRGILIKGGKSYGIEPMDSSKRFEHVLYTMAHEAGISCSVTSEDSQVASTSQQQGSRKPHSPQALSYLWSHTKYVEMFVVVNNQRFQMWGSNINETVQRVMDIIALANSFTRGINTEVVLAGMEIWTEGDLIEVPVDLQVTLKNFNSWRQEKLFQRVKHDVAHMIVGHRPEEDMGQAFLNGACSSGFAAAVESFHHEDVLLFAALMVHELGHNLGIQHDHSACICKDTRFCLMHENITKESGFSNCSSDDFYQFLLELKGACLFNKPQHKGRMRRDAECGNGVVEGDEQCDCGSFCDNNPCCDQTCNLKEHAKCTPGPCCNISCQFEACGHKCRPASGECDLPEYCDGNSDACPEDSYKQDGTTCAQDHYCTQGQCRDLDEQCLNIFGYPARSAPVDCYISMNSKGDRFGNCGHPTLDNPAYVQCEADNMFCGKVICTNIRRVPSIKPQHTVIQVPYEDDWCWSMDMYSTTDIPDDGDVHSGTLCAPDKVCMSHSCTDHAVLNYDCNPAEMCAGKGVCNNLKHCHCDFGYAPPDCKTPGNGGSVDSGPAGLPSAEEPGGSESGNTTSRPKREEFFLDLMVLLLIILLIIILLIIIICAILACKRSAAEEPTVKGPEEAAEKPPEQEPEKAAPEEAAPEEAASEEAAPEEAAPEEAPSEEGSEEEESEP